MAITFVGGGSATATNGGDPSISLPAMQQNDLVIVAGAIGDNDSVDFTMAMITAGYTKVADLHADDTQDTDLAVFWKFMGATPDTTAVFDGQGGTDAACGAVALVFRGVNTTTPMDVTPTTATGINSNIPDPPSIDFLDAAAWTVVAGAFSHTSGAAVTITAPVSYQVNARQATADDTSDITVGIGYNAAPGDPEDPGAFNPSIADDVLHSWCAATLALRPAPPPPAANGGTLPLLGVG